MTTISSTADNAATAPKRDLLRASYYDELTKAPTDGTAVRRQVQPVTLQPGQLHTVHISQAAQTAYQTGTAPAADPGQINVALLKAAAQRRLGRPFG